MRPLLRPVAAALAAAVALCGCHRAARRAAVVPAETIAGSTGEHPPVVTRSDPKPPKPDEDKPVTAGALPRAAPRPDPLLSKHKHASAGATAGSAEDRPEEPAWRARASTAPAVVDPGDRPDAGDQEGTPLARRPEEESVASPGPPMRYLSPAPLRAQRTAKAAPAAADDAPADLDQDPAAGGNAHRPARAPATGVMMDDALPESGISDPNAIGSYHVQIASSPDFGRVLFDKVYPFMGEPDLERDLAGAPTTLETVWIRWAVVDLLDFQHPYSKPKRLKLARRRRNGL